MYHAQVTGLDGMYGDYTSLCPLIQVAEATSTPHLTWTDAPLPDAGLVVTELAAARRHYHAPLTRTAHLGKAPPQIETLAAVIVEGGAGISESFVVTEGGGERLCAVERDLFVVRVNPDAATASIEDRQLPHHPEHRHTGVIALRTNHPHRAIRSARASCPDVSRQPAASAHTHASR